MNNKKGTITSIGEEEEKLEPSYIITTGNVKYVQLLGKTIWQSLKMLNIELCLTSNFTSGCSDVYKE